MVLEPADNEEWAQRLPVGSHRMDSAWVENRLLGQTRLEALPPAPNFAAVKTGRDWHDLAIAESCGMEERYEEAQHLALTDGLEEGLKQDILVAMQNQIHPRQRRLDMETSDLAQQTKKKHSEENRGVTRLGKKLERLSESLLSSELRAQVEQKESAGLTRRQMLEAVPARATGPGAK